MLVYPHAKVNLGLNVLSKRDDGFHNLQSVMVPIGLTDIMEIIRSDEPGLQMTASGISIDVDGGPDLCTLAYELMASNFGIGGVKLHLHKRIPAGAGLGGGSSDAASTLRALSRLFELHVSKDQLLEFAAKLGSDCPFFLQDGAGWVEGRGEGIQPIDIKALNGRWIGIVNPGIHISTAKAFTKITPGIPEWHLKDALARPIEEWMGMITNDFEEVAFNEHPVIRDIRDRLLEEGALYAAMSGTGSTVFGIFPGPNDLRSVFPEHFVWEGPI